MYLLHPKELLFFSVKNYIKINVNEQILFEVIHSKAWFHSEP